MARFNLDDYETVEERIKRFYNDYPDGRIITQNLTTEADRVVATWVVRAEVYLSAGDQANNLPKASGLAFEVDGGNGANQAAALENAETSSIGRALSNAGYSGNRRASRTEMEKVMRAEEVASILGAQRDWLADAKAMTDVDKLRMLYMEAKAAGQPASVLREIEKLAKAK